jgi:hypothetical protein
MASVAKPITMPKAAAPLPAPNVDFYELAETLPAEEQAVLKQVRTFMETKVAPIITKYWVEDAFPFELLPAIKELNIGGVGWKGYGCRGGSGLLAGLVAMEMARFDASIATFSAVHSGLAMGSIYLEARCGLVLHDEAFDLILGLVASPDDGTSHHGAFPGHFFWPLMHCRQGRHGFERFRVDVRV